MFTFLKKYRRSRSKLPRSAIINSPLALNRDLFIRSSHPFSSAPRLLKSQSYAPASVSHQYNKIRSSKEPSGGMIIPRYQMDASKTHNKLMVSHPLWGVLWESSKLQKEDWFINTSSRRAPTPFFLYTPSERSWWSQDRRLLAQNWATQKLDRLIQLNKEFYLSSLMTIPCYDVSYLIAAPSW